MSDRTSTSDREQMAAHRIQNENRPGLAPAAERCTFSGCPKPGTVMVKGYLIVCASHSHFYDEADREVIA